MINCEQYKHQPTGRLADGSAWHAPLATGLSALVLMLALAYALARGIVAMMI